MARSEPPRYVGRFAPSPTGPLHFGSLVAAVASFLQARINDGDWLLRIEDIDPPREEPGSSDAIQKSLETHGFEWCGETRFQSGSAARHEAALRQLIDDGIAYRCTCSRRDLANLPRSPLGVIYPGYCRNETGPGDFALRVRTDNVPVVYTDLLQGRQEQRLESDSGDFIVRRRDGLIAYHLAVVVDDEFSGVTEVVRGIDLLESTGRQIWLQGKLDYRTPAYLHVPVITHPDGTKLSKLTGAPAIQDDRAAQNIVAALVALKQRPPGDLGAASVKDIWAWACENWRSDRLFGNKAIVMPS